VPEDHLAARSADPRAEQLLAELSAEHPAVKGNLLNALEDPTFLRTVLYLHVARHYLPAPKANFVRVVINGEYWGVYVSSEQFNKDFVNERFGTTKGARWKTPGSPQGRGSKSNPFFQHGSVRRSG
jgi:hypothetical protein